MNQTFFISDLHLQKSSKAATRTFLDWLATIAPGSDAVYILGDLFEAWIGDDDNSAYNQKIIAALRTLSDCGTKLYFIHGNRDFILGEKFASAAGVTLLPEHTVIDLYGTPTLIMHGDTLCTYDTRYQELRKTRPKYIRMSLEMPLWQKKILVRIYRLRSLLRGKIQSNMIMDVAPETVTALMEQYHVQHLIHGHTHRSAVHQLTINNLPATRTVLGAWEKRANMLRCTPNGQSLEFFEFKE
ncbi:MAG: UDP-2,3-diacylglucosamine diphosphatase [Gammaproteobacteria bacterium]